jgi:hypothetical protein
MIESWSRRNFDDSHAASPRDRTNGRPGAAESVAASIAERPETIDVFVELVLSEGNHPSGAGRRQKSFASISLEIGVFTPLAQPF